jgi:hypothetical protein
MICIRIVIVLQSDLFTYATCTYPQVYSTSSSKKGEIIVLTPSKKNSVASLEIDRCPPGQSICKEIHGIASPPAAIYSGRSQSSLQSHHSDAGK